MSTFNLDAPFQLESGDVLPSLVLRYHTWGTLSPERDNVVWICHALTGSSDVTSWWPGLVGPGRVIDTTKYFVVCANMPGSCYGSSGPGEVNAQSGKPWYSAFPLVTIADQVRAFRLLRDTLGIGRIRLLIGGSMGGQQVLEWAVQEPTAIDAIVPIATNARHYPWGIAFNAAQRMALEADATYTEERADAGARGLAAARAIGMISYRTPVLFNARQREELEPVTDFRADTYQRHQGVKLVQRFSAHAYYALTRTMDSHDVGRGRDGTGAALRSIRAKALVIGINSDILFPEEEQHFITDMLPTARYRRLSSPTGHDAFLIEQQQLSNILRNERILE